MTAGTTDRSEHSPGIFGTWLMTHRVARGWSRQDLSDAITALGLTDGRGRPLTVSASAVARHEDGNRQPRPRTAYAYRLALGQAPRAHSITEAQLEAAYLAGLRHGKTLTDSALRDIITAAAST